VISRLTATWGRPLRDDDQVVEGKERDPRTRVRGRRRQETHPLEPLEWQGGERTPSFRAVDRDTEVKQLDQRCQPLAAGEAAVEVRDVEEA
jgi:hypothetical protein